MKKKILALFTFGVLATALFFHDEIISFFDAVQIYAEGGQKEIFEIKLTAEQLMNQKRLELLKEPAETYHKASLKLVPYALIEAKFIDDKEQSREGRLLWSAYDGEIVVDTETWQTTHGYKDAIHADANQDDYTLLYALAKSNGRSTKEQIRKNTKLTKEGLDKVIAGALRKNLIVLFNETIKMHMEEPKILLLPISKIKHSLVNRTVDFADLLPRQYSLNKIQKSAKACFGNDFTIRSAKEVFLPVWRIEVKKPDGSISVSYWNAVNGSRIFLS